MNRILFILNAILWGCSFIAIKYVLEVFPPFFSAFLRVFLTVIFLGGYLMISQRPCPLKEYGIVFKWTIMGLFAFTIPWACLFWGQQYIDPSLAGMLNGSVPIFSLLMAWFVIPSDRLSRMGMVGVLIGFIGMGFIFWPSIQMDFSDNQTFWGMVAIVVMAISYSINVVGTRKYGRQIDLVWSVIIQTFTSSILLLALSWAVGETLPTWSELQAHPKAMVGVFYLSFCSTTLAMLMFYHLIHEWGSVKAASLNYLIPFVAIAVDALVLNRWPNVFEWIGVCLIVTALILVHRHRTQTQSAKVV
jgi:drug/metabolite transporter (DMT)-like permease